MHSRSTAGLRSSKFAMVLACLAILAAVPLVAQTPEAPAVSFTGNIGAGFSMPEYSAGRHLDNGWNVKGGAGVDFGRHFGIVGEFLFSRFDINQATLTSLNFPGGNMQLWALTANPVIHLDRMGRFDFYIIGGGGLYHRNIQFTAPTVSTFTAFDPFFGLFYPVAVPSDQVLREQSVLKGGLNIGAGVAVRLGSGKGQLYVEPRYHHMYTRPNATTILPVTFGFRW